MGGELTRVWMGRGNFQMKVTALEKSWHGWGGEEAAQQDQRVTGDNAAPSCGPGVNQCLPGWKACLGITSNKEPLKVGGGGGSFTMK